ncbi:MAG: hypothetical protein IPK82_42235 [Polyangiaceae bacterium]|nr:hypothetical protein [Polyangiaceae bacterium]
MRVLLRPAVFESSDRLGLYVLLWLGGVLRHRVIPDPLVHPAHSMWVASLDPGTARLWEEMVDSCLNEETLRPAHWEIAIDSVAHAVWAQPTPVLPIADAIDLLLQPYRIVLENNVNDRAFLMAIAGAEERQMLALAEKRASLVFEMGGGTTIVPRIAEIRRTESLRRLASVMVDSDALRPPTQGETHQSVEGVLARDARREAADEFTGVHLQVLRRRAIENYLTIPSLRRWARGDDDLRATVDVFEALSPSQQYHYNMKNGFAGDQRRLAETQDRTEVNRIRALYQNLTPTQRQALNSGFGHDVGKLFGWAVRSEDAEIEAREEVRSFLNAVLTRMR